MTITVEPAVLLLNEHPTRLGPMSRRLVTRFMAAFVVWQLLGAFLIFAIDSPRTRAAGLSMVFPGAGLLYSRTPILFVVVLATLVVAFVVWWGISAHFAIPAVWVASVALAAAFVGPRTWGWAIPVGYLALAGVSMAMAVKTERAFRTKRAQIPHLNEYLANTTGNLPEPVTSRRDPDAIDAELLRWCYAFAFQPDDGLDGLDWGEQFHGGTQLRYQLNGIAWAMSLYAANYLPNAPRRMRGGAREGDRETHRPAGVEVLAHAQPDRKLRLEPRPDPRATTSCSRRFLGDVINSYEAATGSTRFDEPGSLTFVWKDGRTFEYDHHTLTDAVRRNFERSKLGFFPCEPGWSFTVCNIFGRADAERPRHLARNRRVGRRQRPLASTLDNEYLTPDGSYAHIRSNHVGISWDTGEVPGGHYFASGTHRFADILPAHARRARALELRGAAPKMAKLSNDGR